MIYFLRCEHAVKIGFVNTGTISSVEDRISSFETGNPFPINILALMPGTQSDELKLHRRFTASRIKGEWFHKTPEMVEFISQKGVPADKLAEHCKGCPSCGLSFLPSRGEQFCSSDCEHERRCIVCKERFVPSKKHPNICGIECQRRFNSTLSAAQVPR